MRKLEKGVRAGGGVEDDRRELQERKKGAMGKSGGGE